MKPTKEKLYCTFYMICADSHKCPSVLTAEVLANAEKLGQPVYCYESFPSCFFPFFLGDREKTSENPPDEKAKVNYN